MREGRANEAAAVARTVSAAKRRVHGACHRSTLESASVLGASLRAAGRLDEAIEVLADTFQRCKNHHLEDASGTLLTGQILAAALTQAGRVQEAVEVRDQVRQLEKHTHPKGNLRPVGRLIDRLRLSLEEAVEQSSPRGHLRDAAMWSVAAAFGAMLALGQARNGTRILVALGSLSFLWALTWVGFSVAAWRRARVLRRHECLAAPTSSSTAGT